jgi:hypothetical protein
VPAPPAPEPDINIYSAANADVEPPRLLSAEILGQLLSGFPKRTNEVEIVVGERGDVQTVQMIGPPQRFPDVMSLSRVKELRYAPAVRNGRPVRYRLRLTWNVTP